jgi:arabinose-5-phosphate isomerase
MDGKQDLTAMLNDKASWLARARDVFETELDSMRLTRDSIGETFVEAVRILYETLERKGCIIVTGVGKNLPIAEKISATMASTGSTSILLNPVQAMHGDLGMLADIDCVLALSFSGESEEILRLLPAVRRRGIPIVGLAGKADCSMAASCDVLLTVDTPREADPFNMAPTASTTATLAMGDALAMVLVDLTGFKRENYARLHPAGAIGKTLLTRVTDIMRTGARLVALSPEATVEDALIAMTKAQAGAAYVVDGAGKLAGIFTDGDLRRSLTTSRDPLFRKLNEVMTPHPISIDSDKMATDVLKIFQAHQIDDIPVTDAAGRLVGGIDISDLPKLKVL